MILFILCLPCPWFSLFLLVIVVVSTFNVSIIHMSVTVLIDFFRFVVNLRMRLAEMWVLKIQWLM